MATKNDDLVRKETFTESYSAADIINQLRLYYVRIHNTEDNFKLQADFGKNITFLFNKEKYLVHGGDSGPFMYTLNLQLKKETNGQLSVEHHDRWKPIDRFRIQGLNSSLIKFGTATHNEKDDQGHALGDYFGSEHYFLFDVQFKSRLAQDFSGKTLLK